MEQRHSFIQFVCAITKTVCWINISTEQLLIHPTSGSLNIKTGTGNSSKKWNRRNSRTDLFIYLFICKDTML